MEYSGDLDRYKERAISLLNDQVGWKTSSKSKENILIEAKPSERHNCSINRQTIQVNAPLKVVMETVSLTPGSRRTEWDTDVQEVREIQRISDTAWVQLIRTNGLGAGVISPREFVDVIQTVEQTENSVIITGNQICTGRM
ncbi:stAR-related lipid transfer protein 5-like [Physella acuta]|uniref:stAR-related lipid transfer protein 5-like n=1 Tax=Physella acuta TaxID=109671 RepID=UPI0027DDCE75|nr:stAR-related lipid transfer protein 5-like [Physella acuta]